MKKKLLFILFVVTIVSMSVFTSYSLQTNNYKYTLVVANIEALTASEDPLLTELFCYRTVSSKGNGNSTHVTYCGDCEATLCKSWSDQYICRP